MEEPRPNFYNLYQKVGEIDGKLESFIKKMEEHDTRLNCVEKTTDQLVGKVSIAGAVFGFVGGIIVSIFTNFISDK